MNKYEKDINDYSRKYIKEHKKNFSFESVLVDVRRKQVLKSLNKYKCKHILEIGCGLEPLFKYFNKYESYTVVEPSNEFVQHAEKFANGKGNINIIYGFMEEVYETLLEYDFDFIIVSSLLHEVSDPVKLLHAIYRACNANTVVHMNVPNVYSFHRLLAYEMNYIGSIFEKSETGIKLQRHTCFDKQLFFKIVKDNNFKVLSHGTYFIKPFTNEQMEKIINQNIVNKSIIKGLEKMIKYMPDLGCEMFINAKINL
jgi:SAM-dependent methyltransferase